MTLILYRLYSAFSPWIWASFMTLQVDPQLKQTPAALWHLLLLSACPSHSLCASYQIMPLVRFLFTPHCPTLVSVHLPPVYTASHALSRYYRTFSHHGSSAPLAVPQCTKALLLAETFLVGTITFPLPLTWGTFIYLDLCDNCRPVLLIQLKPLCRMLRELALRVLAVNLSQIINCTLTC